VVLGNRVWDQEAGIELQVGPMNYAIFLNFLPGKEGHETLLEWARFFTREEFHVDLALILLPEEVPGTRLSAAEGTLLGWTSWLRSEGKPSGAAGEVRL
jgi:type VI secretion system protein ImpH